MVVRRGIVVLAALVVACSGGKTYPGVLLSRGQDLVFQACGADSQWWLAMDSAGYAVATSWTAGRAPGSEPDTVAGQALPATVYAVLRAEMDPPGKYGPQGEFSRQLRVIEIAEIRKLKRGECL